MFCFRCLGKHGWILFAVIFACRYSIAEPFEFSSSEGISISTEDKRKEFTLHGRLQIDYVNRKREGTQLINDADVKRSWLSMNLKLDDWFLLSRFDIDGKETKSQLASFIEYRGFGKHFWLSAGRHKEPFGMSWVGSIKHVGTPDRSAISDRYTFGRSVGLKARGHTGKVGYQLGVFEDGEEEGVDGSQQEAKHLAVTGRVFSQLVNTADQLFHLGVDFSSRHLENAYAVEMAYRNRRFHLQSEWMSTKTDDLQDKRRYSGIYLEAGWFFTADTVNYKKGVFRDVRPSNNSGAWQLVVRLDDGDGDYTDLGLGEADGSAMALAINWFATTNVRIAMSYTKGEIRQAMENENSNGSELRLRGQYTF